jgi:hypothetical protein
LRIHWAIVASVAALFLAGVSARPGPLRAQGAPESQTSPQQAKPDQPQSQTTPAQQTLPSDRKIAMMIFSTLIALNQANATGNYSVLRDMAAPDFQSAHTTAQVAEAFANLRHRDLDLSPILLFQPKLIHKPEINKEGMLRVTGFFQTQPEQVYFDLIFEPTDGQWKLFGLAVDTRQAKSPAAAAGKQSPAQSGNPAPAPPPGPAPGAKPDLRDKVDQLEASPPQKTKPKQTETYNPLGRP